MSLSVAFGFAVLAVVALTALRDRIFLFTATLAVMVVSEGALRGLNGIGGPSLLLVTLAGAILVSAAEAFGLPGPLARLTRLGIHSAERDYDHQVWDLVAPFAAWFLGGDVLLRLRPRHRAVRVGRRSAERLMATDPPSDGWKQVRDGYIDAVRATLEALSTSGHESTATATWRAAIREPQEKSVILRASYASAAPPSPPWAVLVLTVTLGLGVFAPIDLADRVFERVAAPEVAVGWGAIDVPFSRGDSWDGNAVSDGTRLYLVSRENVQGFWGAVRVRSSKDGGATWSPAAAVSLGDGPSAARPTIALGPDGSVWVAYAHIGPQVATQFLDVARSTDQGATWPTLARVSPPTIGLIGLPALLITPDVQIVAYTDGTTGAAIIQPLGKDGHAKGSSSLLGKTSRELYSNAQFLDAGFGLAAVGRHVVALWHASDRLIEVSVSDDAGRTWTKAAPLTQHASWARPHLLVDSGRVIALIGQVSNDATRIALELDSSVDGGESWQPGAAVTTEPAALEGVISRSSGSWMLAYVACSGWLECTLEPRIWLRRSADGQRWSTPQPLTEPGTYSVVGVGSAAGRTWAIWQHDLSASDVDRTIEGVRQ